MSTSNVNREGRRSTVLWFFFLGVCFSIAVIALMACKIRIPYFGVVVSRCPDLVYSRAGLPNGANSALLSQLQELQLEVALAQQCPEDMLEPIPEPPPFVFEGSTIRSAVEVAIILDTSGSMDNSQGTSGSGILAGILASLTNETRWEISKNAIVRLLDNPPTAAPISVWGFGECRRAPVQLYPAGGQSPSRVFGRLKPDAPTALADAIEGVQYMVSGRVGREPNQGLHVVIFSDGDESCSGTDVCNSTALIHEAMPYTWLHVVKLTDDLESLKCVSTITGGVTVDAKNTDRLYSVLRTFTGSTR